MKAAQLFDYFRSGPQEQMVSVAEDYPCIKLVFKPLKSNSFYRTLGPDRHEDRRLDNRPPRGQCSGTRPTFLRSYNPVDRLGHFGFLPISDQIIRFPKADSEAILPYSS